MVCGLLDAAGAGHHGGVGLSLGPHFASAALITIDTQVDTLDSQPLEIPGTSLMLPHLA
jgi:hypothetical protein